jgi:hypothetical protein
LNEPASAGFFIFGGNDAGTGWKPVSIRVPILDARRHARTEHLDARPNKFFRFDSMSGLVATQPLEEIDNMDPSNQTLRGEPGYASIMPKFSLNPDTNVMSPLLAHMCRKDPTITTPSGGTTARQWVMTPWEYGDTAPASFIDEIVGEGSDNDGYPILVDGMRLQDLGIKISGGKPVKVDLGFVGVPRHVHLRSDAAQHRRLVLRQADRPRSLGDGADGQHAQGQGDGRRWRRLQRNHQDDDRGVRRIDHEADRVRHLVPHHSR